ncbi:MAG TPA: hypothetical protein ENN13_01735 [Candidatus Altiarchaeales archaeon]|nr:hypothetical protein [Candidatus Altiarchaeales archaeon]
MHKPPQPSNRPSQNPQPIETRETPPLRNPIDIQREDAIEAFRKSDYEGAIKKLGCSGLGGNEFLAKLNDIQKSGATLPQVDSFISLWGRAKSELAQEINSGKKNTHLDDIETVSNALVEWSLRKENARTPEEPKPVVEARIQAVGLFLLGSASHLRGSLEEKNNGDEDYAKTRFEKSKTFSASAIQLIRSVPSGEGSRLWEAAMNNYALAVKKTVKYDAQDTDEVKRAKTSNLEEARKIFSELNRKFPEQFAGGPHGLRAVVAANYARVVQEIRNLGGNTLEDPKELIEYAKEKSKTELLSERVVKQIGKVYAWITGQKVDVNPVGGGAIELSGEIDDAPIPAESEVAEAKSGPAVGGGEYFEFNGRKIKSLVLGGDNGEFTVKISYEDENKLLVGRKARTFIYDAFSDVPEKIAAAKNEADEQGNKILLLGKTEIKMVGECAKEVWNNLAAPPQK